jgi:uncharacterized membrane protein
MFFYRLLGGLLLGAAFHWFSKRWERLNDETKKMIIEAIIEVFKDMLHAFYKWWKSQKRKEGEKKSYE